MHSPAGPQADARGVVALVGSLAAIYLVSQFLRNSVGVIAPNLAARDRPVGGRDRPASSASSSSFAAAQIPLGIALDRYGPKRCMLVCAVIALVGTLAFAAAATPAGLIVRACAWGSARPAT